MTDWNTWQITLEGVLRQHLQSNDDGSHDLAHLQRVWRNCKAIADGEKNTVDKIALVAAAYLHDLVNLPKDHPDRSKASRQSADEAEILLAGLSFPTDKLPTVKHAIEAHSFSAALETRSTEARVLQDADRLDALGALGIARTFYVAGMLQSSLFDPDDPLAENREPDDRVSALDHFYTKLLRLPAMMHTPTARNIAAHRVSVMQDYLEQLKTEIVGN